MSIQIKEYYHLEELRKGSKESFTWIFDKYHSQIFHYCWKFLKQKNIAEEATIDVFIILWKKRHIINSNNYIKSFLYKVATDTSINYLKKIASSQRVRETFMENYFSLTQENGESILIEKEKLQGVEDIIDTLPPRRKQIFKMRYMEGKDNHTIATQLKISLNTVKSQLVKAKHELKKQLYL